MNQDLGEKKWKISETLISLCFSSGNSGDLNEFSELTEVPNIPLIHWISIGNGNEILIRRDTSLEYFSSLDK